MYRNRTVSASEQAAAARCNTGGLVGFLGAVKASGEGVLAGRLVRQLKLAEDSR